MNNNGEIAKEILIGGASCDSSSSSMSPVSSPSSVGYVDLYGKRRQAAKVQVLEREIGLLQDEIKSLGGLELASRCCKELDEYIETTPDPLIAVNQISGRPRSFWKNLGRRFSALSWMCCFCGCLIPPKTEACCACCPSGTSQCWGSLERICTSGHCCTCPDISCHCSCKPSCPKCLLCYGCACTKTTCCNLCSWF